MRITGIHAESRGIFGEEVARRLLRTYENEGGALVDLLSAGDSTVAPDTIFPTHLHAVPREVLTRVCHRAVGYLAARERRLSGRTPLRATDWRVLLYSLTSAATLREAIERSAECFEAIDRRCGRMGLRAAGRRAELQLDAGPMPSGPSSALTTLYGIVAMHDLFSAAIGRFVPVEQISVGYKAEHLMPCTCRHCRLRGRANRELDAPNDAARSWLRARRKAFFSEEKKQKTFASLSRFHPQRWAKDDQ